VHVHVGVARLVGRVLLLGIRAPSGATKTLSPLFTKGTTTGPFAPAAPVWMCAAVAVMPLTVILAVTLRSALMLTVPLPVAGS